MIIKPAILPHSFEEIAEKLSRVEGMAPCVQIDLCDGVFGREKTWHPQGTEMLPIKFKYEFDIMLTDWKQTTMNCLKIGASSIVAHVDAFTEQDIAALIVMVEPHKVALGIAVSNDKALEFHADMIRKISAKYPNVFIQVMGIKNIGEQGQLFDQDAPSRVKTLKEQFGTLHIQVDGGMNPETFKLLQYSGVDALVVGSYIFGACDAGIAYGEMTNLE